MKIISGEREIVDPTLKIGFMPLYYFVKYPIPGFHVIQNTIINSILTKYTVLKHLLLLSQRLQRSSSFLRSTWYANDDPDISPRGELIFGPIYIPLNFSA